MSDILNSLFRLVYNEDIAKPTFDTNGDVETVQVVNNAGETVYVTPQVADFIAVSKKIFDDEDFNLEAGNSIEDALLSLKEQIGDYDYTLPQLYDTNILGSDSTNTDLGLPVNSTQETINKYLFELIDTFSIPSVPQNDKQLPTSAETNDELGLNAGSSVSDALISLKSDIEGGGGASTDLALQIDAITKGEITDFGGNNQSQMNIFLNDKITSGGLSDYELSGVSMNNPANGSYANAIYPATNEFTKLEIFDIFSLQSDALIVELPSSELVWDSSSESIKNIGERDITIMIDFTVSARVYQVNGERYYTDFNLECGLVNGDGQVISSCYDDAELFTELGGSDNVNNRVGTFSGKAIHTIRPDEEINLQVRNKNSEKNIYVMTSSISAVELSSVVKNYFTETIESLYVEITDSNSESFSGDAVDQQAVNKQNVSLLNGIIDYLEAIAGGTVTLRTEDDFTPVAIPEANAGFTNYEVLEFDEYIAVSNPDKFTVDEVNNTITFHEAGVYFWSSLFHIERDGGGEDLLYISTWDTVEDESLYDDIGTINGYRFINIDTDIYNETSQTSFTVTEANLGNPCEIRMLADNDELTLIDWEGILASTGATGGGGGETATTDVSDPTTESLSGVGLTQSAINIENKAQIETNEADIETNEADITILEDRLDTLDTLDVEVNDPSTESGSESATTQSAINIENKLAIKDLEENFGKVYVDVTDTGAEFLSDKLAEGENITITEEVDAGGEKLLRIASTGGASVSELSGASVARQQDYTSGSTQLAITDLSSFTWTKLNLFNNDNIVDTVFKTLPNSDLVWDSTNKSFKNEGTSDINVTIDFSASAGYTPQQATTPTQPDDNEVHLELGVLNNNGEVIVSSEYLQQPFPLNPTYNNLVGYNKFSGTSVYTISPNEEISLYGYGKQGSAGDLIPLNLLTWSMSVVEIGNSSTTGGTGLDENVKISDTDTTAGKLIDKISAGSNVTITTVDEGGDEKLLITSSGEVSSIVKQGVNYYNLGSDICNNVAGVGSEIVNISSVNSNGTAWLMKSANGNVLTDIPTVANVTYADGLSPAIPILDNTKAIQMKLRTGNCRVFDTNRNDKSGVAYVEINIFELDSQSIISTNHSLVQTVQLMDSFGVNNASVVGKGQTSNDYVIFELTNLNGIFTLDSNKQYGFTISGTSDQNPPTSVEKIHLMDTALLTVIYEGEVL